MPARWLCQLIIETSLNLLSLFLFNMEWDSILNEDGRGKSADDGSAIFLSF